MDFRLLFCCFDVQSDKFSRSIWTSACFPAALTSNPTHFLVQFGLLPAFSPQQRPIRTTFSAVLDFYRIPAASKSNLACFLLLLDFCRIPRHLKVQSLRLTGGGKIVFLNSKNEEEVQDWYEQIKKIHTDIETDE